MAKEIKKVGLLFREKIVDELKLRLKNIEGCFFLRFNKVGAFAINILRNNLKTAGASMFVTKDSLFKRALAGCKWPNLEQLLAKETGIVLTYDQDIVKTCKILVGFSKENETLELKGAVIKDKPFTTMQLLALAKLPSREVLLTKTVSVFASPLNSFVFSLNQIILKFLLVIEEIKKKRS